ncbi:FAD-dependent oxidoreductase family protein [Hibiscus syriacus]|uniref:WD repeat-containing protein 76 n=1 Tax=Hibiscus syriacus TaxID=106335 RepID=A0A6A3D0A0_HIBSY|nr:FAD-dependent oxidoreductase family protein [Hibiscus syriacus]
MASQNLTEYERKRLENIKRNEEMVAALKIHSKAATLSADTKRQRKTYKVSPVKKPKTETPIVIRRSLRTRGMPPDSNGLPDDFSENFDKTPKSVSPLKPQSPRVSGPINNVSSKEEFNGVKDIQDENFSEKRTLGSCKSEAFESPVKEELDENFSGERKSAKCLVKNEHLDGLVKIEKRDPWLESLDLKPENVARIMPGRIMVVKFFPSSSMRMVAAGNKFGNIAFWNVDSKDEKEDGIYLYRPHSGPISGILLQQYSMSKIYSSCYDGFIRLMDAEKELFELVHSSDDTVYSLSQQANNSANLYFGEGRGGLNVWDIRTGKSSKSWMLHEDRINTISFNLQNSNIMATCSTDGTACIWDLRIMSTRKPKTLRLVSHDRAVHSAYFSPSGSSLATTSLDNNVGITSGANFEDTSMIYHNNWTGRWISSFRGIWGWDDSYIFIGNMKRGVDVISPAQRQKVMTLQSPEMSAIPCRFDAHPCEVGMLAGATSGGQVYIWAPC